MANDWNLPPKDDNDIPEVAGPPSFDEPPTAAQQPPTAAQQPPMAATAQPAQGQHVSPQQEEAFYDDSYDEYDTYAGEDYSDSGGGGWMVWIGILVVFNILSWLFDWGFILY